MHYPTVLALGAADHTYVKCGNGGKAWKCWGGKTGGTPLNSGSGSTNQADKIAGPHEHGGIDCYLVNGVCHQSANRILFPAGIFVRGARGYGLSVSIYGPYGRPGGPRCPGTFDRHIGVTGDLSECLGAAPSGPTATGVTTTGATPPPGERRYFERIQAAYSEIAPLAFQGPARPDDLVQFMARLFDYKIEFNLGDRLDQQRLGTLREIRVSAERSRIELENAFGAGRMKASEFVAESDRQAISFQQNAAGVLQPDEYQALFDLKYGEYVALADPEIVARAYPNSQ
jgi:hypothetical protein